jgi:ArsR family transcriptional regulator, arsenate/arsenite/antimonite-responsive transcriptional repressor
MISCGQRQAVIDLPAELTRLADDFWGDGLGIQPEILVLAEELGCLSGWEIGPLLDLESQDLPPRRAPRLATEDDDVRRAVADRLDRLRADAATRRDFAVLLRRTWAYAEPALRRLGRPTVERSLARIRASLDHGQPPVEIIPRSHIARADAYAPLTEAALDSGAVLVTPCYFAGSSGHVVDLPHTYSVAIGTGVTADTAALRSDAERLAGNLKLLADSTRLMILSMLDQNPGGVGEVAKQVGVAQPTASVHIRQLRDAGLLTPERTGNVVRYRTNAEQLRAVLSEAQRTLVAGGATAPDGSSRRSG